MKDATGDCAKMIAGMNTMPRAIARKQTVFKKVMLDFSKTVSPGIKGIRTIWLILAYKWPNFRGGHNSMKRGFPMNLTQLLTIAVAAGALSLAGCNKNEPHAGTGASEDVQVHETGEAPAAAASDTAATSDTVVTTSTTTNP
jgi:hypothetical protein